MSRDVGGKKWKLFVELYGPVWFNIGGGLYSYGLSRMCPVK